MTSFSSQWEECRQKKPQRQISLMWNKQNSSEYDKLILYPFDSPLIVKTQKRKMNLFSDHIPKQSIWSRLLLLSADWPVKSGALLKCITCTTSDKILHNPCGLVVTLLKHNAVHNRHCKIRKLTGNWHVIHYTSSILASADFYWGPFMGHSHLRVTAVSHWLWHVLVNGFTSMKVWIVVILHGRTCLGSSCSC